MFMNGIDIGRIEDRYKLIETSRGTQEQTAFNADEPGRETVYFRCEKYFDGKECSFTERCVTNIR